MSCFREIQSFKATVLFFSILLFTTAHAQLSMPKIFGNYLVLQRGYSVVIWGKASAASGNVVKIADIRSNTTTTEHSCRKVFLHPVKAGSPCRFSVTENMQCQSSITFEDMMVGDVWLASDQSNMELEVKQSDRAKAGIAQANYPFVGLLKVAQDKSLEPINDIHQLLKSTESSNPLAVRNALDDNPQSSLTNQRDCPRFLSEQIIGKINKT